MGFHAIRLKVVLLFFATSLFASTVPCPKQAANSYWQMTRDPLAFVERVRARAKLAEERGQKGEFEMPELLSALEWIAAEVPELSAEAKQLEARGIPYASFLKFCVRATVMLSRNARVPNQNAVFMAGAYLDALVEQAPNAILFPTELELPVESLNQIRPYPIYPLGLIRGPKPMSAFDYFYHDLGHAHYSAIADGELTSAQIKTRAADMEKLLLKIDAIGDSEFQRVIVITLYELLHEPYERRERNSVLPFETAALRAELMQFRAVRPAEMVRKRDEEGFKRPSREQFTRAFDWLLANL